MKSQDSEDIRYMVEALKVLGVQLTEDWENSRLVVQGCGGRFPSEFGARLASVLCVGWWQLT